MFSSGFFISILVGFSGFDFSVPIFVIFQLNQCQNFFIKLVEPGFVLFFIVNNSKCSGYLSETREILGTTNRT